jgi:hypothetical protein
LFLDSRKTHKLIVGKTQNFLMLKLLVYKVRLMLSKVNTVQINVYDNVALAQNTQFENRRSGLVQGRCKKGTSSKKFKIFLHLFVRQVLTISQTAKMMTSEHT